MNKLKPYNSAIFFLLLITIFLITTIQANGKEETLKQAYTEELQEKKKIQQRLNQLRQENKQLREQNNYMKVTVNQMKKDVEHDGYAIWSGIERKAEMLVKESEGKFKKSWALYLVQQSARYDVEPELAYELLEVETGGTFDPELVGPETKYGHAYGMAQFMKNTAPWIAEMAGLPYEEHLLFNPYYSMQLSLVYLDFLHNKYGSWDKALTAYHRGMGGLQRFVEKQGHAKSWYAEKIQSEAKEHKSFVSAN